MKRLSLLLLLVFALPANAQDRLPGTQKLDPRSIATAPTVTSPSLFSQKNFAFGEPPYLKLPAQIIAEPGLIFVPADTNCAEVAWLSVSKSLQLFPPHLLKDTKTGCFFALKDGVYQVYAVTASSEGKLTPFVTSTVTIGKGPDPIPPVPPDPIPPVPPIPVSGMHVLVIYESSVASNTAKIMNSAAVRDYLNTKCAKEADGKSPSWRVLDKDANMSNTSKEMQTMMTRPRASVPWLVIMSSKGIVEQALPATIDETLSVLRKVGG